MNTKEFHISTGKELLALKDRVRHIVSHWGEDGRYKEAVLKSIIQRFLPSKYLIGNGFVVKQTNTRGEHLASSQIDLLIYDSGYPVLFKEGDFAIVTADSVRAIIEVKANIENQGILQVIKKANELGNFIFKGKSDQTLPFFNGVFSYDGYESPIVIERIRRGIIPAFTDFAADEDYKKYIVNHISFNKDLFYKYWEQELPNNANYVYKINDLSFSFFISNLMDYLSGSSVMQNSNLWFPIDKSIEICGTF